MPRLSRVRFFGVGHPNARMEDLTLDFRDAEGRATDSTLWLRNGGGKSSILNLFFAVIRTSRRDFLGGRAESRRRSLEDYILPGEPGTVVTEWELDDPSGTLDLGEPRRLIAGVYYENRGAETMRRLFYSVIVSAQVPATQLESLILTEGDGDHRSRLSLAAFRQQWQGLRESASGLQPFCTEVQSEWHHVLDQAGLDPDLFRYQLQMNLREGGADELFRFDDDEDFIDFLLDLTVEPERGDDVARNISTFREQLRRRRFEYLPDRELCQGLGERLTPLADLHDRRKSSSRLLQHAVTRLRVLDRHTETRRQEALDRVDTLRSEREHVGMRIGDEQRQAANARKDAAACHHFVADRNAGLATARVDQTRALLEGARRQEALYRAAVPLREARIRDKEAHAYREAHRTASAAYTPDLENVRAQASRYAAALLHRAQGLRERHATGLASIAEQEAALQLARDTARRASSDVAAAEAEGRQLDVRLAELDRRRQALVQEGLLDPERSVEERLHELEQQAADAQKRADAARTRGAALASRLEELEERIDVLRSQTVTTRADEQRLTRELGDADRAASRLQDDPILLRALEIDGEVDWERITERQATTLRKTAGALRARAATVRARKFADDRALLHLQTQGLLPPQPDIEAALEALASSVRAVSAYEWLANHEPDITRRRETALRHPDLSRAIIVEQGAPEAAAVALSQAGFKPQEPLVLMAPATLRSEGPGGRVVLAPGNDGHFDREGAKDLLDALNQEQERRLAEAERLEAEAEQLQALAASLTQFKQSYPTGWFQQRRDALSIAKSRLETETEELEESQIERTRARDQVRDLEQTARRAADDEANRRRQLERLRLHAAEGDAAEQELRARGRALQEELRSRREAFAAAEAKITELDSAVRTVRAELGPAAEEARLLESDAERVRFLEGRPQAAAGPVEELRIAYQQAVDRYEDKAGADHTLELAARYEAMAADARRQMRRHLTADLRETDVGVVLDGLDDPDGIDLLLEEQTRQVAVLQARLFEAEHGMRAAREALREMDMKWQAERRPPLPDGVSEPERAEAFARQAEARARESAARASDLEERARSLELQIERTAHEAESRGKDQQRIRSLQRSFEDVLAGPGEDDPMALDAPVSDPAEEFERIEAVLREAGARAAELDRERRRAVESIRRWCDDPRFAGMGGELVVRFRQLNETSLESEARRYIDQLTLRLEQLERAIGDTDRHHAQLSRLVLDLAETGLRQVKLAANASRVPTRVPEIGGANFLRIQTGEPSDPNARRELIGRLIDEMIAEDNLPGGSELVRRAVRQLARPFRVKVLNPNTAAARKTIPITETAKFSGGEQLTCAILLYCTLANVRARNRGLARQPSSVLLLDNPVGRASRRRFLEMQREFARAMGIQLIYTTAVNDHEALSVLPNIIRLRNERVDRRLQRRLVEVDDEPRIAGEIEAVRIVRIEEVEA